MEIDIAPEARRTTAVCKHCRSEDVYKFGFTSRGVQRYLCQRCGRTFVDNNASAGMRYPVGVISSALDLLYERVSVSNIRKELQRTYGVAPDDMTIYRWTARYCRKAATALSQVPIKIGSMWIAGESMIVLRENEFPRRWFWYIYDHYTRFLLAFHFSESRRPRDAQALMERAVERAKKIPATVITDELAPYLDGVELAFGTDTRHILTKNVTTEHSIYLLPGLRKGKTRAIHTFFSKDTARIFIEGWQVHHNFFRPNSSLGGRTPADAAGAVPPFRSWADVVRAI